MVKNILFILMLLMAMPVMAVDKPQLSYATDCNVKFEVKEEFAVKNLSAKKDWSYFATWKECFGMREKVSLCGMWDFAPVKNSDDAPPALGTDGWANFIVPGYWRGGNLTNFVHTDDGSAFTEQYGGKHNIDLAGYNWSFALDPNNTGLAEKVECGADGSLVWQSGLIADGAEVKLGVAFEQFLRKEYDGYVWYRLKFTLPEQLLGLGKYYLSIGAIDDFDWVYVNGKLVGHTGRETPSWWQTPRLYEISGELIKPGENTIAIRVLDEKGEGGIMLPVELGNQPVVKGKNTGWTTPYPEGSRRDYQTNPDIVRQY